MTEPEEPSSSEIDVLFVGQTGVGKSSLINMITGGSAARVNNDARPCTTQTAAYAVLLEPGLRCRLWDTRGLGEAVDNQDRSFMSKLVDRIRHLTSQQARELKETIRDRTARQTKPILMWCMDAAKIDVSVPWEQFRRVYVEYCEGRAIAVVVVNQLHPGVTGWEERCNHQLENLDLGGGSNTVDVTLFRVRKYRDTSSAGYEEDSKALRALISDLIRRANRR